MTIACAVGRHDGPPSIEHIIPEAVGGVLKTRCVCETCNNNECAKIDAALADDPIVLLHRFKYKTPGWETVKDKVLGRGTMEDGTKVVVRFDEAEGIFKPTVLGGQKSETKNLDGTATISFTLPETPTPARLLELANREYRRRNEPEITLEQLPSRMTITPHRNSASDSSSRARLRSCRLEPRRLEDRLRVRCGYYRCELSRRSIRGPRPRFAHRRRTARRRSGSREFRCTGNTHVRWHIGRLTHAWTISGSGKCAPDLLKGRSESTLSRDAHLRCASRRVRSLA